ncbi:DUF636 domain containing protein [Niveomyces insectorum RCEF 264]|uniref:DUF636 domain containing protein n=1 Tax=Niveomyces insectorum RCEF 264 TaxID=1081102 RepID=A0A162MCB9_9HYPO|nr:DUF636 domain containing protein [Niveomyces insectorum RCEF 264]
MACEPAPEPPAAPAATATRTLEAHCLCQAVRFLVTVPSAALPLPVHMCHCSICRTTHGTFSCFHTELPAGVRPVGLDGGDVADRATGYAHARAAAVRYFCTTCGTHIGDEDLPGSNGSGGPLLWRIATSLFTPGLHDDDNDAAPGQAFALRSHVLTDSAPAGFYRWLPRLGDGGHELFVWNPAPGHPMFAMASEPNEPTAPARDLATGRRVLRVACHCGGVHFELTQPGDDDGDDNDIDEPDLSAPLLDGWLDLSDDSRLANGAHVIGWAALPRARAAPLLGLINSREADTALARYSLHGTTRGFCRTCGATVYAADDDDDDDDDNNSDSNTTFRLAVGLLRAPEGVTAQRWVRWRTDRIDGFAEGERYHAGFARGLRDGLAAWSG